MLSELAKQVLKFVSTKSEKVVITLITFHNIFIFVLKLNSNIVHYLFVKFKRSQIRFYTKDINYLLTICTFNF